MVIDYGCIGTQADARTACAQDFSQFVDGYVQHTMDVHLSLELGRNIVHEGLVFRHTLALAEGFRIFNSNG